jgi:hypothetical protein
MEVFEIRITNKELKKLSSKTILFETKEAAETVMSFLNKITVPGKKLQWECSVKSVLSEADAIAQFSQAINISSKES